MGGRRAVRALPSGELDGFEQPIRFSHGACTPGMADGPASFSRQTFLLVKCRMFFCFGWVSTAAGTGAGCVLSAFSSKMTPPASSVKYAQPPIQVNVQGYMYMPNAERGLP